MKIKYNRKSKSIIEKQYDEVYNYINKIRGSRVFDYSAATYTIGSYRTIVLLTWFDLEDENEEDNEILFNRREQLLNELDELFLLVTKKVIEIE